MRTRLFSLTTCAVLSLGFLLNSCDKNDDENVGPVETYRLTGRIDASRSLATAALSNAVFTVSFNNKNSFGDAQSIINGSFAITGYTGITVGGGVADTLSFFATQANGPAISYLTVNTNAFSANNVTTFYTYNNSPAASFSFNNFPFTNDITSALKEGRGYFRLGKAPKYVFILLDNVAKL